MSDEPHHFGCRCQGGVGPIRSRVGGFLYGEAVVHDDSWWHADEDLADSFGIEPTAIPNGGNMELLVDTHGALWWAQDSD